jgi:hypothetical protein
MRTLTPEEEQEVRDWSELFLQPGWTRLIKLIEIESFRIEATTLKAAKDMNDVWYRRGQVDALKFIQTRQKQVEDFLADAPVDLTNPQEDH